MIKHPLLGIILMTGTFLLAACGQKGPLAYDGDGDGYYDVQEEYYYAFPGYYPIGYYYYPGCQGHHCDEYHRNGNGDWGYGEGHAGSWGHGGFSGGGHGGGHR